MENITSLNEFAKDIHKNAIKKGFWKDTNVPTKLMLIVTEISEACEADRKQQHADMDKFNKDKQGTPFHEQFNFIKSFEDNIKDSFEDELADAVIRIVDLCSYYKIDLLSYMKMKNEYNKTRDFIHNKKY